jgi:ribosomal protein L31
MKKKGHPSYQEVLFIDTATGYKFVCGSTLQPKEREVFAQEISNLARNRGLKILVGKDLILAQKIKADGVCPFCKEHPSAPIFRYS